MARNKYGGVNDMPVGWLANKENKRVYVLWFDMLRRCYDEEQLKRVHGDALPDELECIITNDEKGKTISINNGVLQFTIPFEPIERYLK